MFSLTVQERKFIVIIMIIFIMGAGVQLLLRRDIAPIRWARSVRQFKININTAREPQLQMLPGIGATLAARILEYRRDKGPFRSAEDIKAVKGVTAKRFDHIKDLIEL